MPKLLIAPCGAVYKFDDEGATVRVVVQSAREFLEDIPPTVFTLTAKEALVLKGSLINAGAVMI